MAFLAQSAITLLKGISLMRKPTEFNVNHYVWVRLTDLGRFIHRRNHDILYAGSREPHAYRPPTEDKDGWSKWQLWCLMGEFGADMKCGGMDNPFETTIRLEDPT